jgi:hypothetical protein
MHYYLASSARNLKMLYHFKTILASHRNYSRQICLHAADKLDAINAFSLGNPGLYSWLESQLSKDLL